MKWYRDISVKYTDLGLKKNPMLAFLRPYCWLMFWAFVLAAGVFLFAV